MPGAADFIQRTIHGLEEGVGAKWVKIALTVFAILALSVFYLVHEFKGFAASQGMDQAQIGRNLARGEGFRTQMIRPLAVGQLEAHGKNVAEKIWFDTYNAPLPPLVDAIALKPFKSSWAMTPKDITYPAEKILVGLQVLLLLGSVVILYFLAKLLFDDRLAVLAAWLVLLCDALWRYSISGLPQMLMLFLFNGTLYVLVRAMLAQTGGGRVGLWLALAGVGFGLLALSHALTIWIFLGAFIFCIFHFRPRFWAAVIMLAAFAIIYSPWLVRNYAVCGNPGGVAIYSVLDTINHPEAGHMRRVDLDLADVGLGHFKNKFTGNVVLQIGRGLEYFGWSFVALMFFTGLLHIFRKPETAAMRWLVLCMWGFAFIGMSIYGLSEEMDVAANQLHLLFIPIMTCYGLAYLLVQWNRLEIEWRLARIGFLTLLFLICSVPIAFTFLTPTTRTIRWPPYVPPYISVLNAWMKPNEVIASDMPWAISWYADRKSLWLPDTIHAFTEFNDYNTFGAPVNGLYLTPISGSQNRLGDILKGEYKDWAGVITRNIDLQKFPLKWATLLGLENECVFFSDHDRQRIAVP